MNDQVLVRVGYGRASFTKEVQPFGGTELTRVAIGANRLALHILHDEVGEAVIGRPSVDEARDVGMIELRENLPLVAKSAKNVLGVEPAPDEFDRDFLVIFIVGSRREIDCAQNAPADFANNLVSAKLTANERFVGRSREQIPGHIESRLLDEAARLAVRCEKRFYFAAERVI